MSELCFDKLTSNFRKQKEICRSKYAKPIHENLDALLLTSMDNEYSCIKSLKTWIASRFYFENNVIRSLNWGKKPSIDSCSVLIPFQHNRPDYVSLLQPVIKLRETHSSEVAVFTSKQRYPEELNKTALDDAHILHTEDFLSLKIYQKSRDDYNDLKPELDAFCQYFNFSSDNKRSVYRYFKKYFLDKYLFKTVLEVTDPEIVYSIQFTSNRGYLAAINEYEGSHNIQKIVMQHGAFRKQQGYHQFVGADWAIAWGELFVEMVNDIDAVSSPTHIRVCGNPKLEQKLKEYSETGGDSIDLPATVLYASTVSECSLDALRMFTRVANRRSDIKALYKPHPSGESGKYNSLCDEGLIHNHSINRSLSIYELLSKSDIVVGTDTTVLPEAVAFDIPTIQLFPTRTMTLWGKHGLQGASSQDELNEEINSIINNPEYRRSLLKNEQTIAKRMFKNTENASKEVGKLVKELLDSYSTCQ